MSAAPPDGGNGPAEAGGGGGGDSLMLGDLDSFDDLAGGYHQPADDVLSWLLVNADNINAGIDGVNDLLGGDVGLPLDDDLPFPPDPAPAPLQPQQHPPQPLPVAAVAAAAVQQGRAGGMTGRLLNVAPSPASSPQLAPTPQQPTMVAAGPGVAVQQPQQLQQMPMQMMQQAAPAPATFVGMPTPPPGAVGGAGGQQVYAKQQAATAALPTSAGRGRLVPGTGLVMATTPSGPALIATTTGGGPTTAATANPTVVYVTAPPPQQQQQQQLQQQQPPQAQAQQSVQAPLAFQPQPQQRLRPMQRVASSASLLSVDGSVSNGGGGGVGGLTPSSSSLSLSAAGMMPGMPRTESMESFLSVTSADDDDGTGSAAGEGGGGGTQDKKRRRLQKNRESARECRRRQRAHAEELASRVQSLQAENRHLQNHLQTVQQRVQGLERQKLSMEKEMAALLAKPDCSEEEVAAYLEEFTRCYADYGEQRRKEVAFHLKQLESLLLPTQTTKMSLWTLEQDETFFRDTGKTSLSSILMGTLEVSQEQTMKIQSRRERIRQLVGHLKKSLATLGRLKENIDLRHGKFEAEMGQLQAVLTPTQRAKLVLWVTRNEALIASHIPGFAKETFGMEITRTPPPHPPPPAPIAASAAASAAAAVSSASASASAAAVKQES